MFWNYDPASLRQQPRDEVGVDDAGPANVQDLID
jgi:hypothetical protein